MVERLEHIIDKKADREEWNSSSNDPAFVKNLHMTRSTASIATVDWSRQARVKTPSKMYCYRSCLIRAGTLLTPSYPV